MKSALLALVAAGLAFGLDISKLEPRGYVNDFAGVLDAQAVSRIQNYCGAVERATGAQFAVVTVKSLEGDTVEEAAVRLFEKWGIGKKGTDEGLLLILAIEDRKNRIEVGYGLEPVINDAAAGDVLRSIRPILRQGDYGGALLAAVQQLGGRVAKSKGVTIEGQPVPRRTGDENNSGFLPIIIGFIVLMIFLSFIGRGGRRGGWGGGGGGGAGNLLAGMILGNMLGGGRRGSDWSHGGFGGSGGGGGGWSGGGGFGGFGGGSSGGGGASGGW
jgi:uncharacterized protein